MRREPDPSSVADAERYFERLAGGARIAVLAQSPSPPPEQRRIGPYELVELIGRGGMGAVYRAERADGQFEQRVALKLLPFGLGGESQRERFLQERRTLARLSHRNIARLLDGGVTNDGTPYFVMEYVEGVPIDAYCDRLALDVTARLLLFRQVCSAVRYAHQNLIVHRDLKPANVLVDDRGGIKLLDFGIAKLIGDADSGRTSVTEAADRVLTPEYASPEQIRGEALTVTTDVYSLGVLLFELLTGERPYRIAERSLPLVAKAILEIDPARPSDVAPAARRRSLRGDLDAITLKALEKRVDHRYPSVEALDEDIARYLAARPVSARPANTLYRIGKFARRRKVLVAGAAATAASLFALGAQTVAFSVATEKQAAAVARESDRATEIRDFLLNVFSVSDPNESRGETITARELLDRGAEQLRSDLQRQPDSRAALFAAIATIYERLGMYERAETMFQQALLLYRQSGDAHGAAVAEALGQYARIKEIKGDYRTAEQLARESLSLSEQRGEQIAIARSSNILGRVLHLRGDYDDAEPYYRRALAIYQAEYGNNHEDVALSFSHLGALMAHKNDFDLAEQYQTEALAIRRRLFGDEDLRLFGSLNNLADLAQQMGNYDRALEYFGQALAIADKFLPENHSDKAYVYNGLGVVNRKLGRYDEAERYYRQAIAQSQAVFGDSHPTVAGYRANLAKLLYLRGDLAAAEASYRNAYAALAAGTPDDPYVALVRSRLGRVMAERRVSQESQVHVRESYSKLLVAYGQQDARTREAADNMAFVEARLRPITVNLR
ncbi:MAG: serine/threonine-protein kinase [Steroidobacteraceae bacterium]